MTDELRPIPGYEGLYSVTSDGRVWSEIRSTVTKGGHQRSIGGRWLKGCLSAGYRSVVLSGRAIRVHRLVALAWLENPLGLPVVNHLDGIRDNNHFSNLEWCTVAQNNLHAYRTGLNKKAQSQIEACSRIGKASRGLTFEQAQEIRQRVASGERQVDVARSLGLTQMNVNDIVRFRTYLVP